MTSSNLIKAVAIDDEAHCLDTLRWELNRNCPEVDLVNTFQEDSELLSYLKDQSIDLLFLDINLGSTTGIDLLEKMLPVDLTDSIFFLLKSPDSSSIRGAAVTEAVAPCAIAEIQIPPATGDSGVIRSMPVKATGKTSRIIIWSIIISISIQIRRSQLSPHQFQLIYGGHKPIIISSFN